MRYDNRPVNPVCEHRGCIEPARWDRFGPVKQRWFSLCDLHFGRSLREDARLKTLELAPSQPTVTATVRP